MKKLTLLMMLFILGLCISSCKEEEKSIPIDNTEEKESPKEDEEEPEKEKPIRYEDKVKWEGTIEDNFKEDEILVIIDSHVSDKEYTLEDFPTIEIKELEKVTEKSWGFTVFRYAPYSYTITDSDFVDSNRLIYRLTLKDKGKERVIEAIRKLEEIEFVHLAIPNLSTEGKQPIEEKEKWIRRINEDVQVVDHVLTVEIDEQYNQKLFLPEDFEGLDIKGIYISHYTKKDIFKTATLDIVFEDDGTPAEEHIQDLEKLEFIKSVYPYQYYEYEDTDCDIVEIHKNMKYEEGKIYTIDDFPDLELKAVEDKGNIVMLTLKNPGMKNIYLTIQQLEMNAEKYDCVFYAIPYGATFSSRSLEDEITITLKEEYQDKELTIEDFPNIKMERIFKQKDGSYRIILFDKGYDNIKKIEELLKEYEFIENIKYQFYYIDDIIC